MKASNEMDVTMQDSTCLKGGGCFIGGICVFYSKLFLEYLQTLIFNIQLLGFLNIYIFLRTARLC